MGTHNRARAGQIRASSIGWLAAAPPAPSGRLCNPPPPSPRPQTGPILCRNLPLSAAAAAAGGAGAEFNRPAANIPPRASASRTRARTTIANKSDCPDSPVCGGGSSPVHRRRHGEHVEQPVAPSHQEKQDAGRQPFEGPLVMYPLLPCDSVILHDMQLPSHGGLPRSPGLQPTLHGLDRAQPHHPSSRRPSRRPTRPTPPTYPIKPKHPTRGQIYVVQSTLVARAARACRVRTIRSATHFFRKLLLYYTIKIAAKIGESIKKSLDLYFTRNIAAKFAESM